METEGICQCVTAKRISKENDVIWFFSCTNTNGVSKDITIAGPVSQYPDEETARAAAIQRCEGWVAHCLHEDTLVHMGDGSKQPISSLKPGDQILSTSDGKDRFVDTLTSVDTSKHLLTLEVVLANGDKVVASSTQPILSKDGPVTFASLAARAETNLMFVNPQEHSTRVISDAIEPRFHNEPIDLYSLGTAETKYFFVGDSGLVVKCKGGCGGDPVPPSGICR